MAVNRIREDSLKKGTRPKTRAELEKENQSLREQVESLGDELADAQMALCDIYELIAGGE